MKKKYVIIVFILSCFATMAQETTWVNDPAHSRLSFVIKHLTISEVDGRFADFSVKVTTSKADHLDAHVELTAKIASIDTDVEMRDNHLRSADFFDAEKYPDLTFVSTSLEKTGENEGKMYGSLTFHGITKPVILDVTYFGSVENPADKRITAGFQIKGVVKRSDYNLGAKYPDAMISDEVRIIANMEFSPAK